MGTLFAAPINLPVKSGPMSGMGETTQEITETLLDQIVVANAAVSVSVNL